MELNGIYVFLSHKKSRLRQRSNRQDNCFKMIEDYYPQITIEKIIPSKMIVTIVPIAAVELSKKLSAMTFVFFKGKKIMLNIFQLLQLSDSLLSKG